MVRGSASILGRPITARIITAPIIIVPTTTVPIPIGAAAMEAAVPIGAAGVRKIGATGIMIITAAFAITGAGERRSERPSA